MRLCQGNRFGEQTAMGRLWRPHDSHRARISLDNDFRSCLHAIEERGQVVCCLLVRNMNDVFSHNHYYTPECRRREVTVASQNLAVLGGAEGSTSTGSAGFPTGRPVGVGGSKNQNEIPPPRSAPGRNDTGEG